MDPTSCAPRSRSEASRDRVHVADPVPPERGLEALGGHHVGLLFDRPLTRNAELSAPNKLFEYLMAGLAVVAPHLETLGPLVLDEGIGATYDPDRPAALRPMLEELAATPSGWPAMRRRARRARPRQAERRSRSRHARGGLGGDVSVTDYLEDTVRVWLGLRRGAADAPSMPDDLARLFLRSEEYETDVRDRWGCFDFAAADNARRGALGVAEVDRWLLARAAELERTVRLEPRWPEDGASRSA